MSSPDRDGPLSAPPPYRHWPAARHIVALLVPADPRRSCDVLSVSATATGLSEAIGGGMLEDAYFGWVRGDGFCLYLDEERGIKGLPVNERAAVLVARLGHEDVIRLGLDGDILVTGVGDPLLRDCDVPADVLEAARHGGLLPANEAAP